MFWNHKVVGNTGKQVLTGQTICVVGDEEQKQYGNFKESEFG